MGRKKKEEALETEAPKLSKYAAKKAARRKETMEQRAERLLGVAVEVEAAPEVEKVKDEKGHHKGCGIVTLEQYQQRKAIYKERHNKAHQEIEALRLETLRKLDDLRKEMERITSQARDANKLLFQRQKAALAKWYNTGEESPELSDTLN